jgi:hypothetical protein
MTELALKVVLARGALRLERSGPSDLIALNQNCCQQQL